MTVQSLAAFMPQVPIIERPAPSITWHTFDLKTGIRGPELTTKGFGTFGRIIGEPTDTQLTVRVYDPAGDDPEASDPTAAGLVPGALAGTLPGRSLLVALDQDQQPLWGGMVLTRDIAEDDETCVTVSCSTLEHYFSRRFVGWLDFPETDQSDIVAGLVNSIAADGLPFIVDAPPSGVLRDLFYSDEDDKTVLIALQDLMGLEGGPEFTVDLEWADGTKTQLRYVVRARTRLGNAPDVPVQFVMPGCVTSFTFTEDYTEENGANDVLATSSGQGEGRPTSSHHVATGAIAGGWAKFELRYQPAASVLDDGLLDAAAEEELAQVTYGLQEFALTSTLADAPRVGSDWFLGDDITVSVISPRFPAYVDADGRLVPGFTGRGRATGWEANFDEGTITPTVEVS